MKNFADLLDPALRAVVWATTTPVPNVKLRSLRTPFDVIAYNAAMREAVRGTNATLNDLHTLAMAACGGFGFVACEHDLMKPADIHFNANGSALLARQVVDVLLRELGLNASGV